MRCSVSALRRRRSESPSSATARARLRRSAGILANRNAAQIGDMAGADVAHDLGHVHLQHEGQAHGAGHLLQRLRRVPGPAGLGPPDLGREPLLAQDHLLGLGRSDRRRRERPRRRHRHVGEFAEQDELALGEREGGVGVWGEGLGHG